MGKVILPKVCEECIYNNGLGCTLPDDSDDFCARLSLLEDLEMYEDEKYYNTEG